MAQLVIEKIIQDVDDDELESELKESVVAKKPVITTDEDGSTILDLDAEESDWK